MVPLITYIIISRVWAICLGKDKTLSSLLYISVHDVPWATDWDICFYYWYLKKCYKQI